jgi:hypothetical protein
VSTDEIFVLVLVAVSLAIVALAARHSRRQHSARAESRLPADNTGVQPPATDSSVPRTR